MTISNEVKELSKLISVKSASEAEVFPIDRAFLEPYLLNIFKLDRNEFILCNFERGDITYSLSLFLCLQELWEDISVDDMIEIIKGFAHPFSYYAFLLFIYKYLELNLFDMIFKLPFIHSDIKEDIRNSFLNSFSYSILKDEGDYFFFEKDVFGSTIESWIYIKQRLLLDERVEPAFESIEELHIYLQEFRFA